MSSDGNLELNNNDHVSEYDRFIHLANDLVQDLDLTSIESIESSFVYVDELFGYFKNRVPLFKNLVEQIKGKSFEDGKFSGFNCLGPSLVFANLLKKNDIAFDIICRNNSPHPFFIIYGIDSNYLASFGDSFKPSCFRALKNEPSERFLYLNTENLSEVFTILDIISDFRTSITYKNLNKFLFTLSNSQKFFNSDHELLKYWINQSHLVWD